MNSPARLGRPPSPPFRYLVSLSKHKHRCPRHILDDKNNKSLQVFLGIFIRKLFESASPARQLRTEPLDFYLSSSRRIENHSHSHLPIQITPTAPGLGGRARPVLNPGLSPKTALHPLPSVKARQHLEMGNGEHRQTLSGSVTSRYAMPLGIFSGLFWNFMDSNTHSIYIITLGLL